MPPQAAADVDAPAGLGVAAVMAQPQLEDGLQRPAAVACAGPRSGKREDVAERVVALREHHKTATPAYAHFDKEVVVDHAVQQATDLMKVPVGFLR